jgi:hypothetical protein
MAAGHHPPGRVEGAAVRELRRPLVLDDLPGAYIEAQRAVVRNVAEQQMAVRRGVRGPLEPQPVPVVHREHGVGAEVGHPGVEDLEGERNLHG